MTNDPKDRFGTEGAKFLLVESGFVLEDLIHGFREMSARLARDQSLTVAEVSRARSALASMRSLILEEVKRHESRVLKNDEPGEELDLDAIRGQIGRKLDRIRDTR